MGISFSNFYIATSINSLDLIKSVLYAYNN